MTHSVSVLSTITTLLRFKTMHSQILLLCLPCFSAVVLAQDGFIGGSGGLVGGALGLSGLGLGGYNEETGSPIHAAISSKRTFEIRPIMMESQPPVPSVVDIQPSEQPVQIIFRTQSSPVLVQQVHTPSATSEVEKSSSHDEARRVFHEVHRPVIQDVREIIQPYRRVTQEIKPVVERVHIVVAKVHKRARSGTGAESVPMGYQDHRPVMSHEIGAPLIASFLQMGHNMAMATHNREIYLPDPRLVYQLAKMSMAKRARAKDSRRA